MIAVPSVPVSVPTHAPESDPPSIPNVSNEEHDFLCDFIRKTTVSEIFATWKCENHVPATNPCGSATATSWPGVTCNQDASIIELSFVGFANGTTGRIKGKLPDSIGNLHHLVILVLEKQNMYGRLPNQLCDLTSLQLLNLQRNYFHGYIPKELGYLKQLKNVNLAHNRLIGRIPSSFQNLYRRRSKIRLHSNFLMGMKGFEKYLDQQQ